MRPEAEVKHFYIHFFQDYPNFGCTFRYFLLMRFLMTLVWFGICRCCRIMVYISLDELLPQQKIRRPYCHLRSYFGNGCYGIEFAMFVIPVN